MNKAIKTKTYHIFFNNELYTAFQATNNQEAAQYLLNYIKVCRLGQKAAGLHLRRYLYGRYQTI